MSPDRDPEPPAPEGQVWICIACGKHARSRDDFRDVACVMHAILCYEKDGTFVPVPAEETPTAKG